MNSLKGLFCLIMLTSLVISCERPARNDDEPKEKDPPIERVPERPEETISLERAHEMYKAYQDRFAALTEFRGGEEDASYGWHSVDFYKNYIAYLEYEAKKVKIPISGLRLYYVAYPEDDQSKEYSGYQTYIYVPTYYNKEEGKHIAFDPLHIGEDGKPLPIHDIILRGKRGTPGTKGVMKAGFLMKAAEETVSSIANFGEMCKPNCSE